QTPPSALNRRSFVGAAGLAGLGLLGASRAQAAPTSASSDSVLFEVPMSADGQYELPPLPYAYDALEPSIDAETMRLHHDIHFKGYMDGLNKALAKLKEQRAEEDFPEVSYWQNQLSFNGAGYNLHTVFFQNMAPAGSTKLSSSLKKTIADHFGGFENFKSQFSAVAKRVQGSGWGLLGYQSFGKKLVVLQAEKHQNLTQWGVIPILTLDVWEHAYYLKYQNRRGEYVDKWWDVVNWDNVAERTEAAMKIS
ncbi:MAG: superoxide dismutase, partial [Puniceicoccales bacterium]